MKKLGYHAKQQIIRDHLEYLDILIQRAGRLSGEVVDKLIKLCWLIVDKSDSVPIDTTKQLIKGTIKWTLYKALRRRAEAELN